MKLYPVSCTNNTHHDITDLVNHGMVKNTKTWISWERNITFLKNKNILNLCLRCHILRSYCFEAEVTFDLKFYHWIIGIVTNQKWFNPNKAGLFEGTFFWGGFNLVPPILLHISRKIYLISILPYAIVNTIYLKCVESEKMLASSVMSWQY